MYGMVVDGIPGSLEAEGALVFAVYRSAVCTVASSRLLIRGQGPDADPC